MQIQFRYYRCTLYRGRYIIDVHCTGTDILQMYIVLVQIYYRSTLYRYRYIIYVHCIDADILQIYIVKGQIYYKCTLYRGRYIINVHCTGTDILQIVQVQIYYKCTLYRYRCIIKVQGTGIYFIDVQCTGKTNLQMYMHRSFVDAQVQIVYRCKGTDSLQIYRSVQLAKICTGSGCL